MILGVMLLVFVATGWAQMPVLCGWLSAGTPVDTVLSRLGEPTLKDETGYIESTGLHFEEWTYGNGVTMLIELDTLGVAKNVRIVTADSPCQCPILDGFTIGSQLPEVRYCRLKEICQFPALSHLIMRITPRNLMWTTACYIL